MLKRLAMIAAVAACGTVTNEDGGPDGGGMAPDAVSSLAIEVVSEVIYVRAGESTAVPFTVSRDSTTAGMLVVTGTTSARGVSVDSTTLAAGTNAGEIVVRAASDAATGPTSLSVRAASGPVFAEDSITVSVLGAPGTMDPAFGEAGTQRLDFTSAVVAALPQENKVVLFSSEGVVTRMLTSGTPDAAFGQGGRTSIDTSSIGLRDGRVTAVAATPDGKFVVAGWGQVGADTTNRDIFVVRLTADGQIDPTLTPRVIEAAAGLQLAGSVLAKADGTVVLLGTNGDECGSAIIWTIDVNGEVSRPTERPESACTATLQREAIIVHTREGLVRLAFDSMPDRSFGNAGTAFLAGIRASVHQIVVTASAELLVAGPGGESRNDRCVWRLDANGAPAPDFGTAGCATLPYDTSRLEGRQVLALVEQPDGAVVVAVAYHNFNDAGGLLYRVGAQGQADLDYGALGRVATAGPWPAYPAPMDTAVFLPDRTVLFIGGETDDTFSRRIVRKYWY